MGISLQKKQTISLAKDGGGALRKVVLGLGWDAAKPTGFFGKLMGSTTEIDLDASCVMVDSSGKAADLVWFRQLKSNCGNVQHSGDNRTGEGDGDDESILVSLSSLSSDITSLVFTVNSFTGQNFSAVANAYCRIIDADTGKELARLNLTDQGNHTGLIMAYLKRTSDGWSFTAVGSVCRGRTAKDISSEAVGVVA